MCNVQCAMCNVQCDVQRGGIFMDPSYEDIVHIAHDTHDVNKTRGGSSLSSFDEGVVQTLIAPWTVDSHTTPVQCVMCKLQNKRCHIYKSCLSSFYGDVVDCK